MGVDHHTWTRHVQFTHEYNQATRVCMRALKVHTCVTRGALKLWVTCTVHIDKPIMLHSDMCIANGNNLLHSGKQ